MEKKSIMSKESRQALLDLHEIRIEEKREKRKRIFQILCYAVVIIILFKLLIGTISLPGFVPTKDKRKYELVFNDVKPIVSVTVTKKIPIIPTMIEFEGLWYNSFSLEGSLYLTIPLNENGKVYLDIYSYTCETKLDGKIYDMECKDYGDLNFIPKNDVSYHLLIRSDYGEIYYDGPYIREIEKYLSNDEHRLVIVTGKYAFTEVEIVTHVKVK